jgi:hypothetical protein
LSESPIARESAYTVSKNKHFGNRGKRSKLIMENPQTASTVPSKISDPRLDELKDALTSDFHKACVEAYLANPTASAVSQKALDLVENAINETE